MTRAAGSEERVIHRVFIYRRESPRRTIDITPGARGRRLWRREPKRSATVIDLR